VNAVLALMTRRWRSTADPLQFPTDDRLADPHLGYRGWIHLGTADELRRNGVTNRRRFGRDVVVFADSQGAIHATEATCPHLGAHLGGGTVVGDCLRCPFHHWTFGADGNVRDVPNAKRLPRARISVIPVIEIGGIAFMYQWAPDDDRSVAPPPMHPDLVKALTERDGWLCSTVMRTTNAFASEMGENAYDRAHFPTTHGRNVKEHSEMTVIEQPDGSIINRAHFFTQVGPRRIRIETETIGADPLSGVLRFRGPWMGRSEYATFVAPMERDKISGLYVVKTARLRRGYDTIMHLLTRWMTLANYRSDGVALAAKERLERPVLSDADGPIMQFRRWHQGQLAPQSGSEPL
jgi:phenylpropionate dioxygenase-like ring-hydroxylating dioxygenase large terminal subunit